MSAIVSSNLAESNMYDWRAKALMNWVKKNEEVDGSLKMEKLVAAGHLDQYHYLGLQANDEVIKILGLTKGVHILDVGAGIGGPARYLAWRCGVEVTGVDIQQDLVTTGQQITEMVGLGSLVHLRCGDNAETSLFEDEQFDAFVSLLVILHIESREKLFQSLFKQVKKGGGFLIEDMIKLDTFGVEENRIAKEVIGSPYLPNIDEYRVHLEEAGFVDIVFESLTKEWVQWASERSRKYDESKEEEIKLHGAKVYDQRSSFYADVKKLFLSGKLGGVRITGRKPTAIELAIRAHRASHQLAGAAYDGNVEIIESKV